MSALRKRTYEILDIGKKQDKIGRIIDIFLILLISLNVLSVILETLPSLNEQQRYYFQLFEIISVIIFTVEYLARVWSAIEEQDLKYHHPFWGRIIYMLTPMAMIDLIVILPFYLSMFVGVDLRFMRVLRLLRVFKLTRYSSSMSLLLQVLHRESRSIGAALFVLFMMIIVASSLTYFAEHDAQPDVFSSIPAAMWWAIVTMTTVGYGDVIPATVMGKVLASMISIMSLGIVALPAGLLASGFSEALRQRRRTYEKMVDMAVQDGVVDEVEHSALNQMRESLGITKEEAAHIMHTNLSRKMEQDLDKDLQKLRREIDAVSHDHCPHCNHHIEWIKRRKSD
ncbi:ion transporter [Amphritea balenae]|uniref:Ion transporter n=1 Tax=Amphritea balenae TaxID=452629 RepID=A0A3P1SRZ2_9GAMM|nr:ion transporter [Amphritea balenae]RRC99917.1 ion transporter [Amphritea balenae]GGK75070.1 potassium voltage gated channel, Shab-related subfamily, member 2 [Amphritea balenae]